MINRVVLIILDSVGIGALPDARLYGDEGANTIAHIAQKPGGLNLPNMQRLGLGNITNITGVPPTRSGPLCFYGKMSERSAGKDTTTGHWEMAGIVLDEPFKLYGKGFPPEIIDEFKASIKSDILGNYAASGTKIIKVLGGEHVKTGKPIVYTSADSVFQIAAHEEVIPLEKLYEICKIARGICDKHSISRVIARPFLGDDANNFYRTPNRRDFSILPPKRTILDMLKAAGENVIGIGKIEDIFAKKGVSLAIHTKNNSDGMQKIDECMKKYTSGLIFTNLIEFDMLYGHRNDAKGYARALEEFDSWLGGMMGRLTKSDLLIITADHGCDPTMEESTDHTREYVPLLVYYSGNTKGDSLGVRNSFCDVAKTIAQVFDISEDICGKSFLDEIIS